MEQNKTHSALLECIKDSAFLVKDGIVTQVNEAAQKHLIRPGADLDMLLESGEDEYNTFTQGCLCLTVTIFGASYRASVIKSGDCDLFILHGESDTQIEAALNAYALAAMNLRGPMSKLSLALEKILPLVSQLENEELAESIGRLNQGFYQLHRIIANMADAKEYSNGFAPNLEQTNVTSLVADIFEQVCSLLQSAQYHLQLTNLSKPLFCLVDRGILQRAIYNMIANALKFSDPQDSIQVTLRHTGSRLYLTVQNQNKYPRNFYGDYFGCFLREPGLEDPRNGVGLGMIIIQAAARAHGGAALMEQDPDGSMRQTMFLQIRQTTSTEVHSPILLPDYAGDMDHAMLELVDSLPHQCYAPKVE